MKLFVLWLMEDWPSSSHAMKTEKRDSWIHNIVGHSETCKAKIYMIYLNNMIPMILFFFPLCENTHVLKQLLKHDTNNTVSQPSENFGKT